MKVLLVVTLLVAATCAFPQNPFEDLLDLIEHRIERWENRLVYPGGPCVQPGQTVVGRYQTCTCQWSIFGRQYRNCRNNPTTTTTPAPSSSSTAGPTSSSTAAPSSSTSSTAAPSSSSSTSNPSS